jgi:CheY-like chemotaxis protein
MTAYTVLVVDDQHDSRHVLRSGLESLGESVQVIDLPSGEEALLVSARQKIDLLVSDIHLVGMTGLEFMEVTKKRNPNQKVILVTGLTDPKVRAQVAKAGANAFFYKPVNMADFLDAVERILGMVQTSLPVPVFEDELTPQTQRGCGTILSELREKFQAQSTFLFDNQGLILARSGETLDRDKETALLPVLVAAFNATTDAGQLLGQIPVADLHWLPGKKAELYWTHISQTTGLLIVTPSMRDENKRLDILRLMPGYARELGIFSDETDETLSEYAETIPVDPVSIPEIEEDMSELTELLDQVFGSVNSTGDADQFWETAVDQEGQVVSPSDGSLSYEQAKKMGLTPGSRRK